VPGPPRPPGSDAYGSRQIAASYFNQHYSSSLGHFCYALSSQHCRHVHSHWSGVFNLLKFDYRLLRRKKERQLGVDPKGLRRSATRFATGQRDGNWL